MVSKLALVTSLLVTSVALAVPSPRLEARLARRREVHQSQPFNRVDAPAGNVSNIVYDSNWGGSVCVGPEGSFTSVTGTFTIPNASGNEGSGAAIWVGIDGFTCANAILQTGVEVVITGGVPAWDAWYEWYPDYSHLFSGVTVSAGDVIKATVTASSTTSGTAVIENLTTGVTVTQDLMSSYALCEEDAEWIVEDFSEGGGLVPLADFGTVTFTNAIATGPSGTCTPSAPSATLLAIEQNGKVYTSVTASGDTVAVQYE